MYSSVQVYVFLNLPKTRKLSKKGTAYKLPSSCISSNRSSFSKLFSTNLFSTWAMVLKPYTHAHVFFGSRIQNRFNIGLYLKVSGRKLCPAPWPQVSLCSIDKATAQWKSPWCVWATQGLTSKKSIENQSNAGFDHVSARIPRCLSNAKFLQTCLGFCAFPALFNQHA